ncbi:MAG TPA: hypothetical protein VGB59_12050 [Allosphingosinicella sp.]|jgi:hypothetical protein
MVPILARAAALALACGSAACAAPAAEAPQAKAEAIQPIIRGGCRQGQCRWLRVQSSESADPIEQGQLRKVVVRSGTSHHPDDNVPREPPRKGIEWEDRDQTYYAFCSIHRPAFAFPDESGGYVVHFLDLYDLAGYQSASADTYMRICHALDEVPEPEILRTIGYRPGTRSEQVEAADPQVMTRF